jgi:cytochrome oxidase Cu insertion factor (SCO1/SenC/PrrC family)
MQQRGRWKMLLVLCVCAAPLLFSYLTYYVIKPQGRTNYGTLIDPRDYPVPAALGATTLDGKATGLAAYKGKWIMLQTGSSDCADACRKQLFAMRQLRLMQGKEMERIERVWMITDAKPLDTMLIREYDGVHMLRVPPQPLKAWLPVEAGDSADGHIFLIDPLGNLMMRFPRDAEPAKVKKDISKLLMASAIG